MENKIVGTFCEKCRQIMCTCNNTIPPKEIYVSEFALAVLCKEEHTTIYINKVKQSDQITYLSEQSVLEMLSEKDKTIDNMAFGMQRLAKELGELEECLRICSKAFNTYRTFGYCQETHSDVYVAELKIKQLLEK